MLRTEHISRSTKKEDFLPLLGYEVSLYHVPMYLIQKEPKKKKKKIIFLVFYMVETVVSFFNSDMCYCSIINDMVFSWKLLWWDPRIRTVIMDMDIDLELDCYISMDTCTVHRHIFNWVMFMGRGTPPILFIL
jgi:hypothetical protein